MGPAQSFVRLGPEELHVRMGVHFEARIPRAQIVGAVRDESFTLSIGVHGFWGKYLVNGSTRGIVRLSITPDARASFLGVGVALSQLSISLEEPDAFLRALALPDARV